MTISNVSVQQPRPGVGDRRSPESKVGPVTLLPLNSITVDLSMQMREEMDQRLRREYSATLRAEGWVFPPLTVYRKGEEHILSEGFHRYAAALDEGLAEIPAEVRPGTRRDALLNACGSNAAHGLRRSAADKRKAVQTLLDDPEWSGWTDGVIAEKAKVSRKLVNEMRKFTCNRLQVPAESHSDNSISYDSDADGAPRELPADASPPHRGGPARGEATAAGLVANGVEADRDQAAAVQAPASAGLAPPESSSPDPVADPASAESRPGDSGRDASEPAVPSGGNQSPPEVRRTRDGRTINVSRIGKTRQGKASGQTTTASANAASQHVIMVTAALNRLRKVDNGLIDVDTLGCASPSGTRCHGICPSSMPMSAVPSLASSGRPANEPGLPRCRRLPHSSENQAFAQALG